MPPEDAPVPSKAAGAADKMADDSEAAALESWVCARARGGQPRLYLTLISLHTVAVSRACG